MADFSHLPMHCKFVMPQWDFLDFLAMHGERYQTFDLHMLLAVPEKQRATPMHVLRWLQLAIRSNVLSEVLAGTARPPCAAKLVSRLPLLKRIPARVITLSVRREHVHTLAARLG